MRHVQSRPGERCAEDKQVYIYTSGTSETNEQRLVPCQTKERVHIKCTFQILKEKK
jgi:hypothetical protein